MFERISIGDCLQANMIRNRSLNDDCAIRGNLAYSFEHQGKIEEGYFKNTVTTYAKNLILNGFFNAGPLNNSPNTWYMGIISNASFSATSPSDTVLSHPGWGEFSGYYIAGNPSLSGHRGIWNYGTASGGIIGNSSPVSFTFLSSGIIQGIFVLGSGGTGFPSLQNNWGSGNYGLWSTALLNAALPVDPTDIFNVSYYVAF